MFTDLGFLFAFGMKNTVTVISSSFFYKLANINPTTGEYDICWFDIKSDPSFIYGLKKVDYFVYSSTFSSHKC